MLIIRYRRVGKRNHAQYKIVVAEKSFSVKGKFVEALGSYDPHSKEVVLKEDRIKYWLGVGAQCSDSVHNLLVSNGLIEGEKRKVSIKEKAKEESDSEGETKSEGEASKAPEEEKEAPVEEEVKKEEKQPVEKKEQPEKEKEEAKPEEVKKEDSEKK